jgi:hypothetical protein
MLPKVCSNTEDKVSFSSLKGTLRPLAKKSPRGRVQYEKEKRKNIKDEGRDRFREQMFRKEPRSRRCWCCAESAMAMCFRKGGCR